MKARKKRQKILCPECKTGHDSYKLDPSSPVCPYFECYNGVRCNFYRPTEKKGIKKIIFKIKKVFYK